MIMQLSAFKMKKLKKKLLTGEMMWISVKALLQTAFFKQFAKVKYTFIQIINCNLRPEMMFT